jgi:iron complex outermembrane receptor protein
MARGGFRADWQPTDPSLLTLQGDIYGGQFNQIYEAPVAPKAPATFPGVVTREGEGRTDGGNVVGRWTRTFSAESDLQIQTYYDQTSRKSIIAYNSIPFNEDRDTFDASLQHRFPLGSRQDVVWGLGYRISRETVRDNYSVSLTPDRETTHLESAFVQDEVTLVEDRLRVTFGTKLEHNDYTGVEVQPSGRLIWTPQERQSVWASVSRAVRTPSRIEEDVMLHTFQPPGVLPFPAIAQVSGSENFQSEKLMAYELGYRIQPVERVSFDVALFYNDYNDLRTVERRGLISPPPFAVGTAVLENLKRAEGYGGEISANWKPLDWWRLRASYSRLDVHERLDAGSVDASIQSLTDTSPKNQASIYSSMDLPYNLELDCDLRYVDDLSNPSLAIPAYTTMDLRIGWRPYPNLEFSIVGQDLFSPRHLEFRPTSIVTQTTEVERAVYGKITWRF